MNNLSIPTKLADLVEYQDDATVSNTLVKKQAGTITLFAFDREQALSEHTAPYDALVVVLEGKMEIAIGGEPHGVHAFETILLPAGIPHALRAQEASKMLLTMIRSE